MVSSPGGLMPDQHMRRLSAAGALLLALVGSAGSRANPVARTALLPLAFATASKASAPAPPSTTSDTAAISASGIAGAPREPKPADPDSIRTLIRLGRYPEAEREARSLVGRFRADHADSEMVASAIDLLVEALWRGGRASDPQTRPLAEHAIHLKEIAPRVDSLGLSKSLNNLGVVLVITGNLAPAISTMERTLAIRERVQGPDHPDVAKALENLSIMKKEYGDFAAALALQERALGIRERALSPTDPLVGRSLANLAELLRRMGDYSRARPLYERAVTIGENTMGPDHPETTQWRHNMALCMSDMGDEETARPILARTVEIYEKLLGPESAEVATALNNLGESWARDGNWDEARRAHERALRIRKAALAPDDPMLAWSFTNLGLVMHELNQDATAESLLKQGVSIWERKLGPDHPNVATGLHGLATISHARGEIGRALALEERALGILERSVGTDHPDVVSGLAELASIEFDQGDRRKALDTALRAEGIGNQQLRIIASVLAERQALAFSARRASGLDIALSALVSDGSPSNAERCWDAVVRGRAVVLDEAAMRHQMASRMTSCAVDLAQATERLANLMVRGIAGDPPENYRRLLDQTRQERDECERRLAVVCKGEGSPRITTRAGLADVLKVLPPRSALIGFVRYGRRVPVPAGASSVAGARRFPARRFGPQASYLVFIFGTDMKTRVVPLGDAATIDSLVDEWGAVAGRRPEPVAERLLKARYQRVGDALRRAVWEPVAPWVVGAELILWVPDGSLNLVNPLALPMEGAGYLVESVPPIQLLSTERDLADFASTRPAGTGLLAVGGVDFDAGPVGGPKADSVASLIAAGPGGTPAHRAVILPPEEPGGLQWVLLPGTLAEVDSVSSLFEAATLPARGSLASRMPGDSVYKLTGARADKATVMRAVPGRRILHFATHAFFSSDYFAHDAGSARGNGGAQRTPAAGLTAPGRTPLALSGLVFSGANRRGGPAAEQEAGGVLLAEEIAMLDLTGCEWAVLSACATGVGQVRANEGVFGLRRAFRIAGARTVIMSLWEVEDEATRQWMTELYRARLEQKLWTAGAVRQASLNMLHQRRARGESTHPFYWGAFVAVGDWR